MNMALDEEKRAIAKELNFRIEAHPDWTGSTSGRQPLWYGRMLTSLVIALGEESIKYLTAAYSAKDGNFTAAIVIFTPTTLIVVNALGQTNANSGEYSTVLSSRSELKRFTLAAETSVFNTEAFSDWPGALSTTLTYADGFNLSLPLGRSHDSTHRAELDLLIKSLRDDLVA